MDKIAVFYYTRTPDLRLIGNRRVFETLMEAVRFTRRIVANGIDGKKVIGRPAIV